MDTFCHFEPCPQNSHSFWSCSGQRMQWRSGMKWHKNAKKCHSVEYHTSTHNPMSFWGSKVDIEMEVLSLDVISRILLLPLIFRCQFRTLSLKQLRKSWVHCSGHELSHSLETLQKSFHGQALNSNSVTHSASMNWLRTVSFREISCFRSQLGVTSGTCLQGNLINF